MKQARRKELKTNELSVYLQQVYETASRNATYIIGGVVVVVLVLVIGLMVRRNRLVARQDAWRTYYSIRDQSAVVTPELIDQARNLGASHGSDDDLGPRVSQLRADLAYALAITLSPIEQKERRTELFNEAKAAYEQMIHQFGSRPNVVARARMSLAAVEESLALAGQGDRAAVRRLYQDMIDAPVSVFQADAEARLDSLDERLTRLPIIATRPAQAPIIATRPAQAPIIATRPAEPAVTQPTAPTTQPTPTTAPAATTTPATTRP